MMPQGRSRTEACAIRYLVDAPSSFLQHLFCTGEPQPDEPFDGRSCNFLRESTRQGSLAHPRLLGEAFHREFFTKMILGPIQQFGQPWAIFFGYSPVDKLRLATIAVRVHNQATCNLARHAFAEVLAHDVQA